MNAENLAGYSEFKTDPQHFLKMSCHSSMNLQLFLTRCHQKSASQTPTSEKLYEKCEAAMVFKFASGVH